jgi:hypothetical protein
MKFETNQNTRAGIVRALSNGKTNYLGVIEANESEFHVVTLGKLVFAGTACNIGLLVDWDTVCSFESWENPAEVFVEDCELELV